MPKYKPSSESKTELTSEQFEALRDCVCPLSLVYDPMKAGSIDKTDTVPHDRAICRAINSEYVPNLNFKSNPECTIFVARLNSRTTEKTLKRFFSEFGPVRNCCLIRDIVTGASRRYGFVEYETEAAAYVAYTRGNRMDIDGSHVLVDFECGRVLPGWVPRRLGGGFGGKKESGQLRFGCRDRPFKKPINLMTKKEIYTWSGCKNTAVTGDKN